LLIKFADPDVGIAEADVGSLQEEPERLGGVRLDFLIAPQQLLAVPVEE
jgi:hypothetical protein